MFAHMKSWLLTYYFGMRSEDFVGFLACVIIDMGRQIPGVLVK